MRTLSEDVEPTAPTKVAETRYGLGITISRCRNGRMFQIDVENGAKPIELEGHFTRVSNAEDAVKLYVDSGKGRIREGCVSFANKEEIPGAIARPLLRLQKEAAEPDAEFPTSTLE